MGLLATLIYKLTEAPGGIILSGLFIGGIVISLILIVGLILTWLTRLITKKLPFWTFYFTFTAIAFAVFHYQIYSPTLRIVVPVNYLGEVNLIKSKMAENILTLDSNGIRYLNEWTFNHTYTKPIVVDLNGKNLEEQLVGFNNSSFFGSGISATMQNQIKSLSFEIVPKEKAGEKQYYHTDLSKLVDKEKIK